MTDRLWQADNVYEVRIRNNLKALYKTGEITIATNLFVVCRILEHANVVINAIIAAEVSVDSGFVYVFIYS